MAGEFILYSITDTCFTGGIPVTAEYLIWCSRTVLVTEIVSAVYKESFVKNWK
jgi:hypothetical protein